MKTDVQCLYCCTEDQTRILSLPGKRQLSSLLISAKKLSKLLKGCQIKQTNLGIHKFTSWAVRRQVGLQCFCSFNLHHVPAEGGTQERRTGGSSGKETEPKDTPLRCQDWEAELIMEDHVNISTDCMPSIFPRLCCFPECRTYTTKTYTSSTHLLALGFHKPHILEPMEDSTGCKLHMSTWRNHHVHLLQYT